ncbi:uncharacterized protein LOC131425732 [Malaya genurostris]|uniref:uncharacterized protein LOC131425732 n=1 Tax=Malaya genurostris TaxID=325434 RepID=UPI0026F3F54A|nr:uncharacterized protein LOC131425732 [Malaya genurostris]
MDDLNIQDIIAAIRNRPAIWDKSTAEYQDKKMRTVYWEDLCSSLIPNFRGLSPNDQLGMIFDFQRKWQCIRGAYVRSIRRRNLKRPYRYHEHLSFLRNTLKSYQTTDDNVISSSVKNDFEDRSNSSETDHTSHFPHELKEFHQGISIKNVSNVDDDNEDMTFFRSVLPLVEPMTMRRKIEFRVKVMELLLDCTEHSRRSPEPDLPLPSDRSPDECSGAFKWPKVEICDTDLDSSSDD